MASQASRHVSVSSSSPSDALLPARLGHVARGSAPPRVPDDAVLPFLARVRDAHRTSLASGLEQGFLAYVPAREGAPLVAEPDSIGTETEIRWHWAREDATVAFSFHTHPGEGASCLPSGKDLLSALIRGDHLIYILTRDGRLVGWRFRDARSHPRSVDDAMRALAKARKLREGFVAFLYDAFEALAPDLVEPSFLARLDEAGLAPCADAGAFFTREERDALRAARRPLAA